ncbi:hypothetical protein RPMA_11970 [Tardiphaga alba]|uniref:Pentapeptide repeat-containing protein n=1 Tax=Tardiphaga alba TaxID=340268 RepID=A0ABX8A8A2_9BRAD|nr:hypothetical protein [Tardiphaga alba]QUS39472.1 hypothetical protein RPMA_11970 [Tardiphaga alba]
MSTYLEERIIFAERFQARTLDFRGRIAFARYDECEFVKCTILIDDQTENLAFTHCSFEDCNISELSSDNDRAVLSLDNIFKLPIEARTADLTKRLTEALSAKN